MLSHRHDLTFGQLMMVYQHHEQVERHHAQQHPAIPDERKAGEHAFERDRSLVTLVDDQMDETDNHRVAA
jgi:hypothetical protein